MLDQPTKFHRNVSSIWRIWWYFLPVATTVFLLSWAFAATLENLIVVVAGLGGFYLLFTPLMYLGLRKGGNFIELSDDRLTIRSMWISTTHVMYEELGEIASHTRHPWITVVVSKGNMPFEEHVDIALKGMSFKSFWRLQRYAIGNSIHISTVDNEAFLRELRRRLDVAKAHLTTA